MIQGIGRGRTHAVGHEHAIAATRDWPLPGHVAIEHLMHHASAARVGEELAAVADEATGGHAKFQPHPTMTVWGHAYHFAAARAEFLGHHAEMLFRTVNDHHLDRLMYTTTKVFGTDLWT